MVREEAFDYIKNDLASAQFLIMSGGTGAAWYDYFCERTKFLKNLQDWKGIMVPVFWESIQMPEVIIWHSSRITRQ